MYKNKKILALIPARGGSKGIPNKNITNLAGKPLIAYSILAAKNSRYIDDIVVSTDSEKIAQVSNEYGATTPFLRPAELASDTSKTIDCVIHAINFLRNNGQTYDYVILLQPTQPIRKACHIDEAIETIINSSYDSLVSICPTSEHPILMRTLNSEGTLQSILPISSTVRRQDFTTVYKVNGSIYINRINNNLNENTSLNDNKMPYLMDKKYSIDIDTPEDLIKAEEILKNEVL
ncbi:MAG: acylneuraminate cytidylyltransferase family protein [Lachnospiraceae bacterium]|nr:acylneuraminate cytidylyltransferase family protein [Lachnospiraceae bacterium]